MPAHSPAALPDEIDRDQCRKSNGPFRFAGRVLIFFGPLLAVLCLVESALWRTGETYSMERVIQRQEHGDEVLFMRGILDQGFYRYKAAQMERRKPKVLVLGSSRVMEFRAEMFGARAGEFFNGGGLIQDLSDLAVFAHNLPANNTPEVLILGVDFWWFNESKAVSHGLETGRARDAALDWQEHVRAWRKLKSAQTRMLLMTALRATNQNLGMEARASSVGFRTDGSMRYNFLNDAIARRWEFVDRENPPISSRISAGAAQFVHCGGASAERMQVFNGCLDELISKGVLVAGFLPPVATPIAAQLQASHGQSNLWNEVRTGMSEVFAARGLPFIDASVPETLNLQDDCMIDGIHAAEKFQLHVVDRFLGSERFAAHFPKLREAIRAALNSTNSNPWEPDYAPLQSR